MENKTISPSKIHPIVRAVSHRHFIRGFHLSSIAVAIWAVAMVFITVASFETQVQAVTGATVTGRVLAGGAAVPIEKVRVYIMNQNKNEPPPFSSTDGNGVFVLSNIMPGNGYMVQVQVIDSAYPFLGSFIQNLTVTDGNNNLGDIALTPAPKVLTLTVTRGSTGAGVSNVQISAFRMNGMSGPGPSATTDATGTATMRMSGGMWGLNLRPGYGQTADWVYMGQQLQVNFSDNDSIESSNLGIQVQNATATVTGTIKYPNGTAAANLGLNLRNSNNAQIQANTDNNGYFQIKVVAGSYGFDCFLPPNQAQYSCPSSNFTIADNETKDFGIITLTQKTAIITGSVTCNGTPLANANVNAFVMNSQGGGSGNPPAQTGSDGSYSLYVTAGTWGVNVSSGNGSNCVSAGGPTTQVTIADNQTVSNINFTLILADVTINGVIKDSNGNSITNFNGYANAMDASSNTGPGKQFGSPVQGGTFQIKLPSSAMSRATVTVSPPPQGAQYSVKTPATLDIAANQTYSVTLIVGANDASLSGKVKDARGSVVTGAQGEVFISNDSNTEFHNARIQNGSYSFSLLGGTNWRLGYRIEGNYMDQPPSPNLISIASGQNATKDIFVTAADATINVTLKDPNGNLVQQGYANAHQPFNQNLSTKEPPRNSGGQIQNGNGTIHVLGGFTYMVGAGLPPEYSDKNYMPPEEQMVKPAVNGTVNVVLKFKPADGSLKGTATLSTGGTANFGFVGCWSEKGSHTGGSIFNGSYSVSLMKNDIWHCRGNSNMNNTDFYDSGEFTVTTGATTNFTVTKNITLNKGVIVLPQPLTESVDATQQKVITLSDGTTITIPSGALGTSGTYTFTATPTVNLTPSAEAKPALGFGYTLGVTDSSGVAVTTLNSSVTVSFPYNPTAVSKLGLKPTDLLPKYYDTLTNTWQDVSGVTVNDTTHTITFSTSHFTDFALVTGKNSSIALAKVTTSTKNGVTSFTINSKKVTPFSCKGSLKVATKAVNSTQYIAAGTTCGGDVKIYDATGTLKKTVKTGWKGINHVAFGDVTKDSQPDVLVSPVSGREIKAIDVANSYSVKTISLGAQTKWTIAAIDFTGSGKPSLVVAKVSGSTASSFQVFNYSGKKFSESNTLYKKLLKNNSGTIGYTLAAPTLTRLSSSTISRKSAKASLTLTGTNFTPDMTVSIKGVKATVTFVSGTQVKITINGTKIAKGIHALVLTNPSDKITTSKLKVTVK